MTASPPGGAAADRRAWRGFLHAVLVASAACAALLYGFIVAMDPYGSRVGPGRPPRALMDVNQRFMYPQLVRSGRYDGAIIGTSTVRLLDPAAVGAAFAAKVVNLGLNAGTPWEQMQLANLFLDMVPAPRFLLLSLDRTWCEPDADSPAKRLTFRAFPTWLYDRDSLNDYPHLFDLRSLEIAGRVALNRLGRVKQRIGQDGYEVFTPPESGYDLARAQAHIWGDRPRLASTDARPADLSEAERRRLAFPALAWLDALMARLPPATEALVMFPPIHVAGQARPGSIEAAQDALCKQRVTTIAAARGARVIDFRIASPVTSEDANYWDSLHYRLPVAARIVAALKTGVETGQDAPDGLFRVLRR